MREGWKEITIGDIGQVITGNTPPKNDPENYGGIYPFIKPTDMEIDRRYVTNWEENYSEKAFKRYKNAYIPPKATGVVTIGTVGEKLFQANQYCFTNQSVNVVIPSKEYDEDFVFYLLKYSLPKVENANPGTASGRHHVSKSNFCAIKLYVPPLPLQLKIGKLLSTYDDLIENNLKRIKLLEEKAQRTYEEWFVKMRFPGYETAVFDEVTGLPEEWEWKNIGDSKLEIGDGNYSAKYPKAEEFLEKGVPFFSTKEMHNGRLTIEGVKRISEEQHSHLKKGHLKTGDIILSTRGSIGKVAYVSKDFDGFNISAQLVLLRCDNNEIYNSFLYYQLADNNMFSKLVSVGTGTAQPQLPIKTLKLLKILHPTHGIQKLFDNKIKYEIELISILINQNRLLKEARDILLPRLMSGMIDVEEISGKVVEELY